MWTPADSFQLYEFLDLMRFRTVLIGPTKRWSSPNRKIPTQGKHYYFSPMPSRFQGLREVHYESMIGIPFDQQMVTIENSGSKSVVVKQF